MLKLMLVIWFTVTIIVYVTFLYTIQSFLFCCPLTLQDIIDFYDNNFTWITVSFCKCNTIYKFHLILSQI